MSIKLELTEDQTIETVVAELRDQGRVLKTLNGRLRRNKSKLRPHERQDLALGEKVLAAIRIVVDYYGSNLPAAQRKI